MCACSFCFFCLFIWYFVRPDIALIITSVFRLGVLKKKKSKHLSNFGQHWNETDFFVLIDGWRAPQCELLLGGLSVTLATLPVWGVRNKETGYCLSLNTLPVARSNLKARVGNGRYWPVAVSAGRLSFYGGMRCPCSAAAWFPCTWLDVWKCGPSSMSWRTLVCQYNEPYVDNFARAGVLCCQYNEPYVENFARVGVLCVSTMNVRG